MVELFRAEWMKINGNRFMASFTVWLFPVGVTTFLLLTLIPAFASGQFRAQRRTLRPPHGRCKHCCHGR